MKSWMHLNDRLKGTRAVVTGASSGIGQEYARQLAQKGVHLVIAARRLDRLQALAQELKKAYAISVECVAIDLSTPQSARLLFEKATENQKIVQMLVNNAGIGKYGPFMNYPYSNHQDTLQVNVVTPSELTYLFVRHMLQHQQESFLVQVASMIAIQPLANYAVYGGTKSYLLHFSEALAFELKKTNIHVLCLCPGGTQTEFFHYSEQTMTRHGKTLMMSAETVVQKALKAMIAKKTLYIPGFLNQLGSSLSRLIPRRFALPLAVRVYHQAVELPQESKNTLG